MSVQTRISQLVDALQRFFALNPDQLLESGLQYHDYDGPNVEELRSTVRFLRATYEPLISTGALSALGFHAISQLQNHVQNAVNAYDQFVKSRDQGSFQNCATQIDQLALQSRILGLAHLAIGGAQLEAARESLLSELETARINNAEVSQLKAEVKNLIEPAVAGSLSQQFMNRRDKLMLNRNVWLVVSIVVGAIATYATFALVNSLATALFPSKGATVLAAAQFWPILALRSLVLVPLFAGFGFAFAQYRKEREFEEEYAHKAAVAHSLPNYGDLARESAVRDQIVTAASSVIFTSPTEQARKLESSNVVLDGLKEVVESLTKATARK